MKAVDLMDEVILARDYNAMYSVIHNSGSAQTTGSRGCPAMTKKLFASFLMTDGSRFTDIPGWDSMDFMAETQNRDPRLAQSIRTPGYKRMGESTTTSPDFKVTFSGYHTDKYLTVKEQDTNNASDIDINLFRTAEVYLNYAEALAENGALKQEDLEISVNQLRKRVSMPALSMADANAHPDPFLTNPAYGGYQSTVLAGDANKGVILEIRRERGVELCQEGFRYYDVMRWKEGKMFEAPFYGMYFPAEGVYDVDQNGTDDLEIFTGSATSKTVGVAKELGKDIFLKNGTSGLIVLHGNTARSWDEEKDYLYPIPTDDRNLTGGALTQNPGWKDNLSF
jgi:hypothetical protein